MSPPTPEESIFGPSESDIERAEQQALNPSKSVASTALWKLLALLIAVIATAALLMNIVLPLFTPARSTSNAPSRVPARVVGVIDGTTLIAETESGRQTVRYIGVQSHVPGSANAEYAAAVSRDLVGGKDVLLEADAQDKDGDVLLRYVIIDETPINLLIVAAGVAKADLDGPNDRYRDLFRQFEQSARNQQLGIWSSSSSDSQSF